MILYLLLKAVLYIIGVIASVFGDLIPSFPSSVSSVLTTIGTMINGGISFISYFFNVSSINFFTVSYSKLLASSSSISVTLKGLPYLITKFLLLKM